MGAYGMWPIMAGPVYYILVGLIFGYKCFRELANLDRNIEKESLNWNKDRLGQGKFRRMEHSIYFLMLYYHMGRWLRRSHLINSGFTPEEYPLLHDVIYNWNLPITGILGTVILLNFIYDLRREAESY